MKALSFIVAFILLIAGFNFVNLATARSMQRAKEVGIRKVLGADVMTIVGLLSKEFMLLVVVAAVIAFPAAWLAINRWLQDFAYRIDIPLWAFLAAGLLAATVAFLTVGYQAVKAAIANPIKNLRAE